jgi:hypothetical protein
LDVLNVIASPNIDGLSGFSTGKRFFTIFAKQIAVVFSLQPILRLLFNLRDQMRICRIFII